MKWLLGVAMVLAVVAGCDMPQHPPTHEEEFASFCGKTEGVFDFLRIDIVGELQEKYCIDQQGRRHGNYRLLLIPSFRTTEWEGGIVDQSIVLSGRYEADVPVGNWTDNRHALRGKEIVLPHHLSFVKGACSQDPLEIGRKVETFPQDNAGGN